MKRKVGRPSSYTPDAVKTIIMAIERGNFPEVAANAAGVSKTTFYNWCKADKEFLTKVQLAEARSEIGLSDVVRTAADKGEWNAAKWLMGRRFRARWSEESEKPIVNFSINIEGPNGKREAITLRHEQASEAVGDLPGQDENHSSGLGDTGGKDNDRSLVAPSDDTKV